MSDAIVRQGKTAQLVALLPTSFCPAQPDFGELGSKMFARCSGNTMNQYLYDPTDADNFRLADQSPGTWKYWLQTASMSGMDGWQKLTSGY